MRLYLDLFDSGVLELDHKSCEMIAREVIQELTRIYPGRDMIVEVNEDQENGAILEFRRDE